MYVIIIKITLLKKNNTIAINNKKLIYLHRYIYIVFNVFLLKNYTQTNFTKITNLYNL